MQKQRATLKRRTNPSEIRSTAEGWGPRHIMTPTSSMGRNLAASAILVAAVLSVLLDPASSAVVPNLKGQCTFRINKDLMTNKQPLILIFNTSEFLFPQSSDSVQVELRKQVRLVCPGKDNSFTYAPPQTFREVNPYCVSKNVFSPGNGYVYEIRRFECKKNAEAVAVPKGRCLNNQYQGIQAGFELPKGGFASTMDLCFDEKNYNAVYTSFKMLPNIIGRQHNVSRPLFSPSTFYNNLDISGLYRRDTQRQTVSRILGSEKLGAQYIRNDKNYYLARGHLSAKADFIYGSEQISTFFYMNAAPQWQIFNAGNWERLESSVRNYVSKRTSPVTVVTGIWDTCSLPDVNGKQQPLHLLSSKGKTSVKVPGYYWKIVYDPATKQGAAFVGINNPYLTTVTKKDVFCEDVCNRFDWLMWDQKNFKLGYSFCCNLDDFRKTVTTAPDFKVSGLLS